MSQPMEKISTSENLFRRLDLVSDSNVMNYPGMMEHILQCVIALNCMLPKSQYTALQESTNLVFKEALLFVSNGLLDDETYSNRVSDIFKLNSAHSVVKSKNAVWYPLYWAVLLSEKLGINAVKTIYQADPLALTTSYYYWGIYFPSPVNLLCTSESLTAQHDEIFPFFVCYGNDMALLRTITQLAPTKVLKSKYNNKSPLELMMRDRFLESDIWLEMVEYLLLLDNSPKVVYNAVVASFGNIAEKHNIFNNDNEEGQLKRNKAIAFISKILNNCPASVTLQDELGDNPLVQLFNLTSVGKVESSLLFMLTRVIISIDSDVLRQRSTINGLGYLPIHFAASNCGVDVISLLIDEYPESATAITSDGDSILTCSFRNSSEKTTAYILQRYPELNRQLNGSNGYLPLHEYLHTYAEPSLYLVTLMCSSYPEVVKTSTKRIKNIPFYLLFRRPDISEPVSQRANIFRLLLKLYPAAANIKNEYGNTPYTLAVDRHLDTYFIRLLLRADPLINPQELHRLNYQERRMALFISSGTAIYGPNEVKATNAKIWKTLWTENRDMLKEVISFL